MSDKKYNIIKWLATVVIPAFITCVIAIFTAWNIPYLEPLIATLSALNVFIGAVVQRSSKNHHEENIEEKHK